MRPGRPSPPSPHRPLHTQRGKRCRFKRERVKECPTASGTPVTRVTTSPILGDPISRRCPSLAGSAQQRKQQRKQQQQMASVSASVQAREDDRLKGSLETTTKTAETLPKSWMRVVHQCVSLLMPCTVQSRISIKGELYELAGWLPKLGRRLKASHPSLLRNPEEWGYIRSKYRCM